MSVAGGEGFDAGDGYGGGGGGGHNFGGQGSGREKGDGFGGNRSQDVGLVIPIRVFSIVAKVEKKVSRR